jgi:membrane protease YdiL (CAAX protease family)
MSSWRPLEPPAPEAAPVTAGFVGPAMSLRPGPAQAWLARPYPQLLRGPNYRWWRSLVSLAVVAGALVVVLVLPWVAISVYWAATGAKRPDSAAIDRWTVTAPGLAWTNLTLAALIVCAQLAVWGGFGWRPRWVASVAGGVRWSWLLRCCLAAALVIGLGTAALVAADGGLSYRPPGNAGLLALVVLVSTPLQAAGEEYFFRGWLNQAVGSLLPRAAPGAVVAALVSSTLFALAHGQQDPWLFVDRFGYGMVACWLVWRTGGLEASIALHAVLNLFAFGLAIASNQVADMLDQSAVTPIAALSDVALILVAALLLDQVARRTRVARLFQPPIRAL